MHYAYESLGLLPASSSSKGERADGPFLEAKKKSWSCIIMEEDLEVDVLAAVYI